MTYDPPDPQDDPFHPPAVPTEVSCLHCGKVYDSYLIEWRVETDADGREHGFWCCPTPGCGGMGFGFDILPTDPAYRDERGGWVCDDEDEDFDDDFDEEDDEFDDEGDGEGDEFDDEDIDDAADSYHPFGPGGSPNGNGESHKPGPDDEVPF